MRRAIMAIMLMIMLGTTLTGIVWSGGPSGVVAAQTAARTTAKVYRLERLGVRECLSTATCLMTTMSKYVPRYGERVRRTDPRAVLRARGLLQIQMPM